MASLDRQRLILGVVVIITVIFLTPLIWMFITSLRPTQELFSYPMNIIPKELSLENYSYVFTKMTNFFRYFLNSLIITISTVVLVLISSATVKTFLWIVVMGWLYLE